MLGRFVLNPYQLKFSRKILLEGLCNKVPSSFLPISKGRCIIMGEILKAVVIAVLTVAAAALSQDDEDK